MQSRYELDGQLVGRLLIYKVGDAPIVEYLLPLRINLHKGVSLVVDEKSSYQTQPLYCDAPGCVGFAPLNAALSKSLTKGRKLQLLFAMQGDSRVFAFPFPLDGFTTQYQAWKAGHEK